MKRDFTVLIERGEDGYYLADVVELPGCRTQAKTLDELMQRAKEAIELYLEVSKMPVHERFIGVQKIQVSA